MIDDQEAVAAFMKSLHFEWVTEKSPAHPAKVWFNWTDYGSPFYIDRDAATFFHQALKQREDELYERIKTERPLTTDCVAEHHEGFNACLNRYDAAIDAAFRKNN